MQKIKMVEHFEAGNLEYRALEASKVSFRLAVQKGKSVTELEVCQPYGPGSLLATKSLPFLRGNLEF